MIKSKLVNQIDDYGDVIISVDDAIEFLLNGDSISGATIEDSSEVDLYNSVIDSLGKEDFPDFKSKKEYKLTPEKNLKRLSEFWFIPTEYLEIDIIDYLSKKCKNAEEINRMAIELEEFNKRNQMTILTVMIFLVDQFRKNNVVWGVGRGSSVSCFCFYLIGINKINPMAYDISHTEFFKEDE